MSLRGVNQVALFEPEVMGIARLDANGVPKGITGTVAQAAGADFRRALGLTGFTENVPQADIIEIQGDGGIISQYQRKASGVITLENGLSVFDQTTMSELKNDTVYTEGSWNISMRTRKCLEYKQLAAIISGRCESLESGTAGELGWYTIFYWKLTGEEQPYALTIGSATATPITFSANETDTTWWEEDLDTNYDVSYSWASRPIISDYPLWVHTYVGDGNASQTTTLQYTPAAADGTSVQLWEDGTKKTYTTNYTVSTSTKVVSFVTNPAADSDNLIVYEYVPGC